MPMQVDPFHLIYGTHILHWPAAHTVRYIITEVSHRRKKYSSFQPLGGQRVLWRLCDLWNMRCVVNIFLMMCYFSREASAWCASHPITLHTRVKTHFVCWVQTGLEQWSPAGQRLLTAPCRAAGNRPIQMHWTLHWNTDPRNGDGEANKGYGKLVSDQSDYG